MEAELTLKKFSFLLPDWDNNIIVGSNTEYKQGIQINEFL